MKNADTLQTNTCVEAEESKLWSLDFGRADCIMTTVVACLFAAHVAYPLCIGPENVDGTNYFSGYWVMAILLFSVMIFRPSSNTTRVPAVIWIGAGLGALVFNFFVFR